MDTNPNPNPNPNPDPDPNPNPNPDLNPNPNPNPNASRCMDTTAMNYNQLADAEPDASTQAELLCIPTIFGCTYKAAGNYDSTATTPSCPRNGTCYDGCYWDISGCTDSTVRVRVGVRVRVRTTAATGTSRAARTLRRAG